MKKSYPFFASFIVIICIITMMSYVVWYTGVTAGLVTRASFPWVFAFLIIFPLILIATSIYSRVGYNRIVSVLYTISTLWFPTIIYLFIGSCILAVLSFGSHINLSVDLHMSALCILGVIVVALVYGVWNANCIRIKKYTINSKELAPNWRDKKIVLFSDVHIGIVRGAQFMEKIVAMINDLKPDLVILAGDVIDGPIFDYKKGLSPLSGIVSKEGIIYTPGNHEEYNREPEKFYPILESLTTMLVDKKIIMHNTQIIGLQYAHELQEATANRLEGTGFDPNIPSIVILHDPTNTAAVQRAGVSLVVSGHTHNGQFFPSTLLMRSMYKEFAYGKNVKGKTTSITTAGVGTTMPPFRLGANPEIVVLTFE